MLRDVDGRLYAVASHAVAAASDTDDGGILLLLSGGRMLNLQRPMLTVLA